MIGLKIKFIDSETGNGWINSSIEISSMLSGLIKTRKKFLKRDLEKSSR